ncbi:MAG: hypothetical protein AB1486_30975 [Planctomycetota bacterium]
MTSPKSFLGVAGLVSLGLSVFAANLKAQDSPRAQSPQAQMMEEWMNCELCRQIFEAPDLMAACDYWVLDSRDGVVCQIVLKDPTLMGKLRAFEAKDKAASEKFKTRSAEECAKRLCKHCAAYFGFLKRGLAEERIETPSGTLVICRTSDPKLLKDVHGWAEEFRQAMASFEASETAPTAPQAAMIPSPQLQEMKKCYLCALFAESPEMLTVARPNVVMLKNGVAIVHTVQDKQALARYQEFQKRFHERVAKLKDLPQGEAHSKLCGICQEMCDLTTSGATFDWSLTDTGDLTVMTASDPAVVRKIQELGKSCQSHEKVSHAGAPK